jgi:hypothetical protein
MSSTPREAEAEPVQIRRETTAVQEVVVLVTERREETRSTLSATTEEAGRLILSMVTRNTQEEGGVPVRSETTRR